MAKDNVIGLAMGLDITDLKAGINEVKKLVKQSKDEFNVATAGLDKWTKSSDGLTAKLKQLDKQLDAQKKAVEGYKAEIERVSKLEGDHSIELENLKSKLQQAEIAVKKTELSISKYNDSLSQINAENKKAESSFGKLTSEIEKQKTELSELEYEYKDAVLTYGKNSKEAKALAKQIDSLSGELNENQNEVKKADKALENLEKQFDDTEEEAEDFGSAIENIKGLGGAAAKGIGAIGATIGGLATAFFATAESTKELRTNMGKVQTAFEVAGLSAEQATKTYEDLYAVVADEGKATEATSHIAKLAKSQEDLSKWVNISTGVYATFGDSLPIENLAEASNETAKTGKITGGLADALNWAGVSEEKFQEKLDNLSTEQERNKLITETLNGLYSKASKQYQETNKDVIASNKAQAELSSTMAQLGEKAEPLLTALKEGFNQVLQAVIELLSGADFEAIKAGIENAFDYFVDEIIPAIKNGFTWIMDNKDTLIAGIVAIGTGMLAWNVVSMVQGVVAAIKGWTTATTGMTLAQKALNLVMKANPIGIVITAITALVSAFIYLWNTSDEFRAFWIDLWEKIKSTTSKVIKVIGDFFSDLWVDIKKIWGSTVDWFKNIGSKIASGFQKALNSIKDFFSKTWSNIKDIWSNVIGFYVNIGEKIIDAFKNIPNNLKTFFSNAWNNVKNAWSNVTSFFSEIKDKIINSFKELPSKMTSIGSDLVKGLWNGIKDMTSWITGKLKSFGDSVLGGIKKFFGIHSPSKETEEIGGYLAEGMVKGLEKGEKAVEKAGIETGEAYTDGINDVVGKTADEIIDYFNDLPDPKVKVKIESKTPLQQFVDNLENALGISETQLKQWSESVGGALSKISSMAENAIGKGLEIVSSIGEMFSQSIDNEINQLDYELEKFNKTKDAEIEKQQELYDNGIINEEQFALIKKQLEDEKQAKEKETLKKKDELAKRQFESQKATSIGQALISGALAIMKGFEMGPIPGAINAAAQAIITGVQVGTIASQQYVPMLAKGGIVDSPTFAMIGEAGKEAVMPLENNTGWISDLAQKISSILQKDFSFGVNQSLVPVYSGPTTINNYYTQNITAPKSPSRIELYRDTKNLLSLKGV